MKIYVGNLPFQMVEDEFRAAFEAFGEVSSAKIITDKFSGRSKGFGFVEMPNADEANKAIGELNGKDFQGRTLRVQEAQEKPPRSGGFSGGGGGGFGGGGGGGGVGGGRGGGGRGGRGGGGGGGGYGGGRGGRGGGY